MSVRAERIAVALLLVASVLLFSLYSVATPLFEASDELWHFPLVRQLATTGSLPEQRPGQTDEEAPWRQEGSQPPLYYTVAAMVTAPIDASNWREIRRLNPHTDMGRPTRDGNANAVLHTADESFPWTRATLAVHLARFVSVLFSTLTVWFAYLVARELFPRLDAQRGDSRLSNTTNLQSPISNYSVWLRLGTMVFTAFVPMFAFISGSVNNDNAAAMFGTLGLWWALRTARRGDLSVRAALIAGLITAAGALSKSSTLGLVGLFALAALIAGLRMHALDQTSNVKRQGSSSLRFAFDVSRFVLLIIIVVALLAGWWFIRNQQLYGDLLGWNAFLDVVGRREPPASLEQLWTEREGFVWAYWGVFGTLNVILPPLVYDILNGGVVVALVGMILAVIRQIGRKTAGRRLMTTVDRTDRTNSPSAVILLPSFVVRLSSVVTRHSSLILSATWLLITFAALVRWTTLTPASQGRLMFPCMAVIAAGMAFGLYRLHRAVLWVAGAGLIALAVAVPFTIIMPAYAQPPYLANPTPANRLDISLGDALDLIGYDVETPTVEPGDEAILRLYWRARAPLPHNYSVFAHLINEDNVIIAQRDMYPGQGSLATSELSPGYTWSESYATPISSMTLAPQHLRWAVGMYDLESGQRLTVTKGVGSEQGIVFGRVALTTEQNQSVPLLIYANGIALNAYEVQPRSLSTDGTMTVTLQWQTNREITEDYTISLQLLDEKANKIAQHDAAPMGGSAPTSTWEAGTAVTDTHMLQISPDAPAGVYRLLLILYSPKDFSRLGAYDERGQYISTEIELMRVRVGALE